MNTCIPLAPLLIDKGICSYRKQRWPAAGGIVRTLYGSLVAVPPER